MTTPDPLTVTPDDHFAVTFVGDAWEWFYGIIQDFTDKNLAVEIDGRACRLVRIEGDLWDPDLTAVLVVDNDLLATGDAAREESRIHLYESDGQCAIRKVRLL